MSLTATQRVAGLLVVCLVACEGEVAKAPASSGSAAPVVDRKAMATGAAGSPSPAASGLPKIDFQEFEFGESERSRDPFRSFEQTFVDESRTIAKSQRQVLLQEFAVDELKLIGIVTGVPDASAMLVDPHGKGHVVHRGQFLGRAEIVHGDSKGAPAYEVNWRIDRIRDGDIVLVRADPKNPEVPSSTRVIPLHTDPNAKVETLGFQ